MTTLSIKDVPEAWTESLRQRAARNHRSLQGELMFLIEQAIKGDSPALASAWPGLPAPIQVPGRVIGLDRQGQPIVRQGWKSAEKIAAEIAAESAAGQAQGAASSKPPRANLLSSIDIIRQDRDSR